MSMAVDQNRLNMKKLEADLRRDGRKFFLQAVVALVAAFGAGAGLGNYYTRSAAPAQTRAPQVIYLVPGQAPALLPKLP